MIKVAHIGKATALTDIQDLPVCLRQKIDCIFQALLIDIPGRCFSTYLLHQSAKMAWGTGGKVTHSFITLLEIFDL